MTKMHSQWRLRFASPQRGLAAVTVLVILVMFASLAAAVARLSMAQSASIAADVDMARAMDTARSGMQYGLYQATKGSWTQCGDGTVQTLDLRSETGFRVTVSCARATQKEIGETPNVSHGSHVYVLNAIACNGDAPTCPDDNSVGRPTYVERRLQSAIEN